MPIKKILTEGRVPVKIWTDDVEDEALKQLEKAAKLPFIFKHIAVMPDVHGGIGCTVGSVIATKGAMCPATLGVDIGCGMMAVKLEVNAKEVQDKVVEIRKSIERSVPVGFSEHQLSKSPGQSALIMGDMVSSVPVSLAGLGDFQKAIKQYGSLGGGNHFIELCTDTENNVWVMLHSGSRGIGNKIGNYFINEAKGLMKKMFIELPTPETVEITPEVAAKEAADMRAKIIEGLKANIYRDIKNVASAGVNQYKLKVGGAYVEEITTELTTKGYKVVKDKYSPVDTIVISW